jgi:predicted ribosome-associated RNA-binding protein Tma20
MGPNNPLTSNIFTPSIEAILNKRFTGGTIVPKRLENLSPQYQYTEETSEISKFLGQMGVAPMAVDYLLDRYFGFVSDIILPATTKGEPIWGSVMKPFTVDTAFENQTLNNFYEEYNKLLTQKADAKFVNADSKEVWIADEKQGIIQKHTTKINEYYSILRHLEQPEMSESERADLGDKVLNAIEDSVESLEEGATDAVAVEAERDLEALLNIGMALVDGEELTRTKRDELKRLLQRRINAEAKVGLEHAREIDKITLDEILGIISIEQNVSIEEAGNILEEIIGGSQ